MGITTITTEDLRRMEEKEGLILQGCGGDLKEWVDGINDMLTGAGILKEGSRFGDVSTFQYGELTCLLFPFEDVKLEMGKLAMWRLQTHGDFGGIWLSDFVPNRLGGTLRRNGMAGQAKEMTDRVFASGSYHEALNIIGEYVNITSVDEPERRPSVRQQMKEVGTAEPSAKQKPARQQER